MRATSFMHGELRAVVMDLVEHDSVEMSHVYTHTELMQKASAQEKLLKRIQPLAAVVPTPTSREMAQMLI